MTTCEDAERELRAKVIDITHMGEDRRSRERLVRSAGRRSAVTQGHKLGVLAFRRARFSSGFNALAGRVILISEEVFRAEQEERRPYWRTLTGRSVKMKELDWGARTDGICG